MLQRVLGHLWQKQEDDSARLAREIHDGISQQATALKLGLAMLGKRAGPSDQAALRAEIEELQKVASALSESATRMMDELHPPILETLGLGPALQWKAERVQSAFAIPVSCSNVEQLPLRREQALTMFRIASDWLDHVHRQNGARQVEIRLERNGGQAELRMEGGLGGFDTALAAIDPGLVALRLRAKQRGGALTFETAPDRSAILLMSFPLDVPDPPGAMRVLIADDHPLARRILREVFELAPEIEVSDVDTIAALRAALSASAPDVLILDLSMPGGNGFEMLRNIIRDFPELRVLVASVHREDQAGIQCMLFGARGYINKDTDPNLLIEAVRRVHGGERYMSAALSDALDSYVKRTSGANAHQLSPRERTVLRMIVEKKSDAAMADEMNLGVETVATYRARIMEKLQASTEGDLERHAKKLGLAN